MVIVVVVVAVIAAVLLIAGAVYWLTRMMKQKEAADLNRYLQSDNCQWERMNGPAAGPGAPIKLIPNRWRPAEPAALVIPVKTGIQGRGRWIPAFAGMTLMQGSPLFWFRHGWAGCTGWGMT